MAEQWLGVPGEPSADIAPQPNGDGIVNFFDFAIMAEHWLEGEISNDLIAYWSFDDGSATDFSDNSNNGTIHGATIVTGVSGSAVRLDGVDDYISIPYSSDFAYTIGQDSITVSAWVNPLNPGTPDHGAIYSDRAVDNGVVAVDMSVNQDEFTLGGWSPTATGYSISDVNVPDANQWYLMTAVFDSIEAKLYINGSLASSVSLDSVSLSNGGTGIILGKAQGGYWENYFNGIIDEVRVYNRALSANEIRENCHATGLCAHYRFENFSGPVIDETGVHSGVNNGAARGVSGKVGNAFDFDGIDDYVDTNYQIGNLSSDKTINFWLKTITAETSHICSSYDGDDYLYIFLNRFENTISYGLYDGTNEIELIATNATYRDGNWHMVTITQDGASYSDIRIYIDGISQSLTDYESGTVNSDPVDVNIFIGARNINGVPANYHFANVELDEIRVYNRTLSASEVLSLFQNP